MMKWFRKAVDQGLAKGQAGLGLGYESALGVAQVRRGGEVVSQGC
jgi:TPR repeat protein